MSSNGKLETNSKTNSKESPIARDNEHFSKCRKDEKLRLGESPETKEKDYTSKKISKNTIKQSKQGPECKHTRHVYSKERDKEQDGISNKTQQSNLHVRYWTYLFDNLHRSIDEIFCACESEENLSGCHVSMKHYFVRQLFTIGCCLLIRNEDQT